MALTRRALSRREWLQSLPLMVSAVSMVSACGLRTGKRTAHGAYQELFRTPHAKQVRILVLMPDTEQTRQVWTGLSDELQADVQLIAVAIDRADQLETIARAIRQHAPTALVLINNPTVAAYRAFQQRDSQGAYPPAIILMTSLLEEQNLGIKNATGIRYEVPLVAVVTNLRRVLSLPLARVGVIRRNGFARLVQFEATLAAREKVELVAESVTNAPNASEMKAAIRRIKGRADALWILNDDKLLSPRLLADAWVPGLNETPYIPTIVGVRSLVSANAPFGDFAVLPDHTALGSQAAGIIFDLIDSDWQLPMGRVQPPLSTTTVIHYAQANERFQLRHDALSQVDEILR